MPVVFDSQSMLVQMVWESANFASGAGTSTFGLYTDANGATALNAIATGISQAWQASLRALTDSDITLDFIRWETDNFSGEVSVALAGSAAVNSPPPNAATLITYKAAEKGPRNRGRNFWPGLVSEGDVDERGIINNTRVAAILTEVNDFFEAVEAIPDVLGQYIVQSSTPGQATPPNLPWPQVIERGVSPLMATQRRRLRR